jgi:hypothetical protein
MKKEFKEILSELGIESSQRLYDPSDKIRIQIPTEYNNILTVNVVYNIFKNKASFLYKDFETHQDLERIKNIANRLDMKTPGRISRVDWEIIHKTNPSLFTFDDNKKVLFSFIKGIHQFIGIGDGKSSPNPNDILIAFPWDGCLFAPIHHPENARKRSVLNQKFGFSKVDEYNYQYAKYDKDLNLYPI